MAELEFFVYWCSFDRSKSFIDLKYLNDQLLTAFPSLSENNNINDDILTILDGFPEHCIDTLCIDLLEKETTDEVSLDFKICIVQVILNLSRSKKHLYRLHGKDKIALFLKLLQEVAHAVATVPSHLVYKWQKFLNVVLLIFEQLFDPCHLWKNKWLSYHNLKYTVQFCENFPYFQHLSSEFVHIFFDTLKVFKDDRDIRHKFVNCYCCMINGSAKNALLGISPFTVESLWLHKDSTPNFLIYWASIIERLYSISNTERQIDLEYLINKFIQLVSCRSACVISDFECLNIVCCLNDESGKCFIDNGGVNALAEMILKDETYCSTVFKVLNQLSRGCQSLQFRSCKGYQSVLACLKKISKPSVDIVNYLFQWAVGEVYNNEHVFTIEDGWVIGILVDWMSCVDNEELFVYTLRGIKRLLKRNRWNLSELCNCDVTRNIINCISLLCSVDNDNKTNVTTSAALTTQRVDLLFKLLERLGAHSLNSAELRAMLLLLQNAHTMCVYVCRALTSMARKELLNKATHWFELGEKSSGLALVEGKTAFRGSPLGFSVHTWISLDPLNLEAQSSYHRRILFRFLTPSGCGFEAAFTQDYDLLVSTCHNADFHYVTVPKLNAVSDGQWHLLHLVFAAGRGLLGKATIQVFFDGNAIYSGQLRYPKLTEDFLIVHIGACPAFELQKHLFRLASEQQTNRRWGSRSLSVGSNNTTKNLMTVSLGREDRTWGCARPLRGQMVNFAVLNDPLTIAQVDSLYARSLRDTAVFSADQDEELYLRTQLHLHALACDGRRCVDLSMASRPLHELQGTKLSSGTRLSETLHRCGGLTLLLSLFNQLRLGERPARLLEVDVSDDDGVTYLALLHSVLAQTENAALFVQAQLCQVFGLLLRQVHSEYFHTYFFVALCGLVDAAVSRMTQLHNDLVRYVIMDWRIWSRCTFALRLMHFDYVIELIRGKPRFYRDHYPVQFFLDVARLYHDNPVTTTLEATDTSMISSDLTSLRDKVFCVLEMYLQRQCTAKEMTCLFRAIHFSSCDWLVANLLTLLLRLFRTLPVQDPLVLLLYEQQFGGSLYEFFHGQQRTLASQLAAVELLASMAMSEAVPERYKPYMQLPAAAWPWLINQLQEKALQNMNLLKYMIRIMELDFGNCMPAMLTLCRRLQRLDLNLKLFTAHRMLYAVLSCEEAASVLANTPSWAESLLCLAVCQQQQDDDEATDAAAWMLDKSTEELSEEICSHVTSVIHIAVWKGVRGDVESIWKKRNEVFVALNEMENNYKMLKTSHWFGLKVLLDMLQACTIDINRNDLTRSVVGHNGFQLMMLLYDFIQHSPLLYNPTCEILNMDSTCPDSWTWFMESVMELLNALQVWHCNSQYAWANMNALGMHLLLSWLRATSPEVCSLACAKLATLVQLKAWSDMDELCFAVAECDAALDLTSLRTEQPPDEKELQLYSYRAPVLKALLERNSESMQLSKYLPHLPAFGAGFCSELRAYREEQLGEWQSWLAGHVTAAAEVFRQTYLDHARSVQALHRVEACADMQATRREFAMQLADSGRAAEEWRNSRKLGEWRSAEEVRCRTLAGELKVENRATVLLWRGIQQNLQTEQGLWSTKSSTAMHWKMSSVENFCRMRNRFEPNSQFDMHKEASLLRDNEYFSSTDVPPDDLNRLAETLSSCGGGTDAAGVNLSDDEDGENASLVEDGKDEDGKDEVLMQVDCERVTLMDKFSGLMKLTANYVIFVDKSEPNDDRLDEKVDLRLATEQVREIHFRRYNLRRSAFEIFMTDQTNYFFNFEQKIRNAVYRRICRLKPRNMIIFPHIQSPQDIIKSSSLTEKWMRREITNFEYLMHLNTVSGRTYNDLSQYPVFPWVLADYTSSNLNLTDPATFRDLSRPIGAVNPAHEEEIRDKYESLSESGDLHIQRFHYGTHYSSAAGVLHYMVRVEPFTTLHVKLQGGKFDMADRQFFSLPSTWQSIWSSPFDNKELIPEFYYLPEMFRNENNFDLGCLQGHNGQRISDVELPAWAKSVEDFIYLHRQALESDYVSAHLHEWLDLIFGYKQKGVEAERALNVFHFCSYEEVTIDLHLLATTERSCIEAMINNFGQTPSQLFIEPHPSRNQLLSSSSNSIVEIAPVLGLPFLLSSRFGSATGCSDENVSSTTNAMLRLFIVKSSSSGADPLLFVSVPPNQTRSLIHPGQTQSMIAVSLRGAVSVHSWLPYNRNSSDVPFLFLPEATPLYFRRRPTIIGPLHPTVEPSSLLCAVSSDARILYMAGSWDRSLVVINITKGRMDMRKFFCHTDVITCLSLDRAGLLITGSRDTTCAVWSSGATAVMRTLNGHNAAISCVALLSELDVAASGAEDGVINVHTVKRGELLRQLRCKEDPASSIYSVRQLAFNDQGMLLVQWSGCTSFDHILAQYGTNGRLLASETLATPLTALTVHGDYLVHGNARGELVVRQWYGLRSIATRYLHSPILHVHVVHGATHVLIALADGKLIVLA